jgi:phosphoglycerate dehydrogenase-like enzyme
VVQVLLTDVARDRFGPGLERPGVELVALTRDGRLCSGSGELPPERAAIEVGWATSDLYRAGAPMDAFYRMLLESPGLRWFQSPAAGYDPPVFGILARRGVRVTNAHVNAVAIAEYVMRAVLDELQEAELWRRQTPARTWEIHDWREVEGTTWLVVGMGAIGARVAVRARAFGARVIGCRRRPDPTDPADEMITPDMLAAAVARADVVVLAAPASPATTNLVDAAFLASMKADSILVNVARGTFIDDEALVRALDAAEAGTGSGPAVAVLDVFRTEPLPGDHPFWTHPRVRITPHNAAGGLGRYPRQAALFSENLERYLAGAELLHDVSELAAALPG